MGVKVCFNYTNWATLFPQFSNVTESQVTSVVLPLAEQYCRNDGGGPVTKYAIQVNLLNLMVAHICQLFFGSTTQPLSPLVGRIGNAAEGTVSVQTEFPMHSNSAWFQQTPYGAAFWQAIAPYRTMRYLPGPRRPLNPWINQ